MVKNSVVLIASMMHKSDWSESLRVNLKDFETNLLVSGAPMSHGPNVYLQKATDKRYEAFTNPKEGEQ